MKKIGPVGLLEAQQVKWAMDLVYLWADHCVQSRGIKKVSAHTWIYLNKPEYPDIKQEGTAQLVKLQACLKKSWMNSNFLP